MGTRIRLLFPLLCIFLAFGLRLINLDDLGLWGDEGWSLYLAQHSLAALTIETGSDIHPPLYYYLLHFWRPLAGLGEFSARYLSVVPGTLVVAATFSLGRRLAGPRVGGIGAVLMACAPFAVHYGHEVRPFMWATLWCACALYALLRALTSSSRLAWAAYAVLSLLSAFTLYSTATWYAAHGVLLLLKRDWRRRLPAWVALEAGALALSLPWLWVYGGATGEHLTGQGAFTGRQALSVHVLAARAVRGLVVGVTLPETVAWVLAGVIGVIVAGGVIAARQRQSGAVANLTLLALLPVLALYPIHLLFPWFEPRVLAFCIVPICLLLAAGLDGWLTCSRRAFVIASAILAVSVGIGLYDYYADYSRYSPDLEDYGPLIVQVADQAAAGDIVLYNAPWHVGYFEAYYDGPELDLHLFSSASVLSSTESPRQVWLVLRDIVRQPGGARLEDQAEDLLSARTFKVGEAWFGSIRLARYAVAPHEQTIEHDLDVPLGGALPADAAVWLNRFAIQPEPGEDGLVATSGEAIYLTCVWQAGRSPDRAYHVFSQLVGPFNPTSGNPVWAQHDGVPGNQERPTTGWTPGEQVVDRHVMWIDPAAPPGDYLLHVGMYDPSTGGRLTTTRSDGTQSDHVVLVPVRVVAP